MDVEVARAGVPNVQDEHRFECLVDLLYEGVVEAVRAARPIEQHQRFGVDRRNHQIGRVLLVDLLEGIRVHAVEAHPGLGAWRRVVPEGHRVDQGPVYGGLTISEGQRPLCGDISSRLGRSRHPAVQVGTPSPRLTEVAHGAIGVPLLRLAEGAGGLLRGERVEEQQPWSK